MCIMMSRSLQKNLYKLCSDDLPELSSKIFKPVGLSNSSTTNNQNNNNNSNNSNTSNNKMVDDKSSTQSKNIKYNPKSVDSNQKVAEALEDIVSIEPLNSIQLNLKEHHHGPSIDSLSTSLDHVI